MYLALSAIRLGLDMPLDRLVDLAVSHDFAGVEPSGAAFFGADPADRHRFIERLRSSGLAWRLSALPSGVGEATTESAFDDLCAEVARRARVLVDAGASGFSTWLAPAGQTPADELEALHRRRLDRLGGVLEETGLRLALEYVGPATSRRNLPHPFVHDLAGMRALIASLAEPERFGLVLDTFHWYTAGESVDDLLDLDPGDVLAVDVNDALPGRDRDDQVDAERALPAATGVIPAASFVGALATIGYRGPLVAEPLAAGVATLSESERVAGARAGLRALMPDTA